MREIWLPVPGYPTHMASTYGDIYSDRAGRNLRPHLTTDGYMRTTLTGMNMYVHQVVAMTFFDEWRPSMRVRHKDGDRTNNRFDNLKLIEPQRAEGAIFIPTGRPKPGVRIRIKETGDVFRSVRDCANFIGGSYSAVYACLRGDRDSHLGLHFEWY